jgi:hypothetical protein
VWEDARVEINEEDISEERETWTRNICGICEDIVSSGF